MGVVYEAFDSKDEAVVALKTIIMGAPQPGSAARSASQHDAAERLFRLKSEFRVLADLQHPNVVRFGELSSHGGEWFFTMELLRGKTFVEYVRAGASFDEGRLRDALAQLVSALAAIHDAGLVHRDVKPSNVLVTEDGRVVVLDFGLTTLRARGNAEDGVSGTPDYMAPEQIEGLAVGPPADWYAVGATLFLAMTGRPAFLGNALDTMSAKLTEPAPAPHDVADGVPPDLDALCVDLMRQDPAQRPGADRIRACLGLPSAESSAFGADSGHVFVGRDHELQALKEGFRRTLQGDTAIVSVEGEAGIGKSALVHQLLRSVERDALVLAGRCYEQETVPFKGIDAIVDAISQHLLGLEEDEARATLQGGVRFLATVFPVLNRVPMVERATANERAIDNPMALREQAFGEFERLIAELARRRPVVLFLDDLQWADRDSVALLARVLLRARPGACLLVTTMRSGMDLPAGASDLLAQAVRIPLSGLSDSESRFLCSELWTDGLGLDGLVGEARGHPLFLAELVRAARKGEQRTPNRLAKLEDVLCERIQERDPIERRMLEVLALGGVPLPYDVVARAAEVDVGECQTRLGALRAAQLLRVSRRGDDRLIVPYHDRVREALLQLRRRAPAHEIERDHLGLGRALLRRAPADGLKGRIFAVVAHLNAGRGLLEGRADRLEVAQLNLVAAREAVLATTYEAAAGYADVGLGLLGEGAWQDAYDVTRGLHLEQMRACFLAGDVARARRVFDAACDRITSAAERTELYVTWVELESNRGDFESALAMGRDRLREVGVSLPRRATVLSVVGQYLATRYAQRGRTPEQLRSLALSTSAVHESAMRMLKAITPAAFWVSSDLVGWISLRLARMSMRHGVTDVSSYGFASYGVILAGAFRKCAEAAALGRLALATNERLGNEGLSASVHVLHGEYLAPWVQPFVEAIRIIRTGYEAAVRNGDTTYEAFAACCISHLTIMEAADMAAHVKVGEWARDVCARRGDWNTAGCVAGHMRLSCALHGDIAIDLAGGLKIEASFRELVGDPAKTPAAYGSYWVFGAWVAYFFGEFSAAAAWLRETLRYEQAHFGHPAMLDLCFLECLLASKEHDTAGWLRRVALRWKMSRCVGKLAAWAAGCPANFEAHHLIASAELARARGAASQAAHLYELAVASARRTGAGLREGLALELASAFAAAQEDRGRARDLQAQAIDAYRRCGAAAKADRLARTTE
jgi:predicted ATPase